MLVDPVRWFDRVVDRWESVIVMMVLFLLLH
jgi:hypothetical protein